MYTYYLIINVQFVFSQAKSLTPNQAAALAIQLFSQESRLCDAQRSKVARTQEEIKTENGKTPGMTRS
jgi:hypothetical protein